MTLRTIACAGLLLATFAATAPAIAADDKPAVSTSTATSPATPPATSTNTVTGTPPPATTTGGSGQAPTVHGCDATGCWHNGPEVTTPTKKCHTDPSGIELCD